MKRAVALVALSVLLCTATNTTLALPRVLQCEAAGRFVFGELTGGEEYPIQIHGTGTCKGDLGGPYSVVIDGAGLADILAQCTFAISGGHLGVTLSITNVVSGETTVAHQSWDLLTLPPGSLKIAAISSPSGKPRGAGTIATRIGAAVQCGLNQGTPNPAALFRWVFIR